MSIINLNFPIDYILVIITLLFTILSTWKGLIQSVLGLMTWVGSIIITLYSYNAFSIYLNNQLLKIDFFKNYESLSYFISIIISIPIIFLISLFILKKIRKVLSSDLDKQILGVLIDKTLGIIYGIIFSYFIFSTMLYALNKFNLENMNVWFINNSKILYTINDYNNEYVYKFIPSNINEEL